MWNLVQKAVLCLLVFQQYCYIVLAGELHTTNRNIEAQIGDQLEITCVATLSAGDSLILSIDGKVARLVNAEPLDEPVEINLYKGTTGQITVAYGDISTNVDRQANVTMSINSVTRVAEGTYTCQYSSSDSESTAIQQVQIVGPPYDANITSESKGVTLEKSMTFDRNAYPKSQALWEAKVDIDEVRPFEVNAHFKSRPAATVTWSKNDYRYESSRIDIERNEDDLDGSEFFCSAVNEFGSYNITMIVMAVYKPREPVVISRDKYPEEGKQMMVECQFDAVPPATVFYVKVQDGTNAWERGNRTEERERNGKYIIDDVELARDIGKYMCVGDNGLGITTGEFFVYGKPKDVELVIGDRYGDSVDLMFKAFSAIPLDFELFYNNTDDNAERSVQQVIDNRSEQNVPKIRVTYSIRDLEPLTSYIIQLKAWNRHGEAWSPSVNVTTKTAKDTRPVKVEVVQVVNVAEDEDKDNGDTRLVMYWLSLVAPYLIIQVL